MSLREKIEGMSQAELSEYLDKLIEKGREESREFAIAYEFWEKNA